ncbi:fimbrial protein [Enterobacter bugandensis]|uniref:fimbrial protein n=1 Tax=Enterobacter bugandensis TaxID=881260 RepID=UPI0012FEFB5E|nr:fimbrial protein [Enterobacter bugandensis]
MSDKDACCGGEDCAVPGKTVSGIFQGFHRLGGTLYCNVNSESQETGNFWFHPGNEAVAANIVNRNIGGNIPNQLYIAGHSYVPETGHYVIQWYLCVNLTPGIVCKSKIADRHTTVDKILNLDEHDDLVTNEPDAGGHMPELLAESFGYNNWCATLFNLGTQREYRPSNASAIWCSDADPMPVVPPTCKFDVGDRLTVNYGTVDSAQIKSADASAGTVYKTVQITVTCDRDAPNATVSFDNKNFTNVSGKYLLKSSKDGLGIQIAVDNSAYTGTGISWSSLQKGVSVPHELTFSLLRDPDKNISDIAGAFQASTVLYINQN